MKHKPPFFHRIMEIEKVLGRGYVIKPGLLCHQTMCLYTIANMQYIICVVYLLLENNGQTQVKNMHLYKCGR